MVDSPPAETSPPDQLVKANMETIQTSSIRRDATPTQVTAALNENVSVTSNAPNQTETSETADTPRPGSNPALYSLTSHPPVKVTPPNKNPEDTTIDTSQVTEATKETMESRLAAGAQIYITGEPKNTPEQETGVPGESADSTKENTAAHENTGAPQNLPIMSSTTCENITTTQIALDHTTGSGDYAIPRARNNPAATPVEIAPPLEIGNADAPIEAAPPLNKQNADAPIEAALPFNNQNSAAPVDPVLPPNNQNAAAPVDTPLPVNERNETMISHLGSQTPQRASRNTTPGCENTISSHYPSKEMTDSTASRDATTESKPARKHTVALEDAGRKTVIGHEQITTTPKIIAAKRKEHAPGRQDTAVPVEVSNEAHLRQMETSEIMKETKKIPEDTAAYKESSKGSTVITPEAPIIQDVSIAQETFSEYNSALDDTVNSQEPSKETATCLEKPINTPNGAAIGTNDTPADPENLPLDPSSNLSAVDNFRPPSRRIFALDLELELIQKNTVFTCRVACAHAMSLIKASATTIEDSQASHAVALRKILDTYTWLMPTVHRAYTMPLEVFKRDLTPDLLSECPGMPRSGDIDSFLHNAVKKINNGDKVPVYAELKRKINYNRFTATHEATITTVNVTLKVRDMPGNESRSSDRQQNTPRNLGLGVLGRTINTGHADPAGGVRGGQRLRRRFWKLKGPTSLMRSGRDLDEPRDSQLADGRVSGGDKMEGVCATPSNLGGDEVCELTDAAREVTPVEQVGQRRLYNPFKFMIDRGVVVRLEAKVDLVRYKFSNQAFMENESKIMNQVPDDIEIRKMMDGFTNDQCIESDIVFVISG